MASWACPSPHDHLAFGRPTMVESQTYKALIVFDEALSSSATALAQHVPDFSPASEAGSNEGVCFFVNIRLPGCVCA
jgi:hypothetical protein